MAQPNNPDLQLVQKAVKGNRKAFTTLFNKYFQSVYNFALTLSRDPALAEDLTQEAFIRAHANLERLGPPWNFRAWIFRLTRNYFIDLTRKEREVYPLEEGEPVISPGPGPEKETMSREAVARVQSTLGRMSVQYREILVLRELNEFSYAEIGEILDLSSSNVKVSLHRARAAFQESYGIRLLLEDPTGDCKEVSELLHAFHDNEELLDQERFVKEHLKDCPECQERRKMLIAQSVALGAFIPVIPPKDLAERILDKTSSPTGGGSAPKTGPLLKILGYGGSTAVLGLMAWFVFTLVFTTQNILPNFPQSGDLEPSPEVLAPPAPTDTVVPPPPPPPPEGPSDTGAYEFDPSNPPEEFTYDEISLEPDDSSDNCDPFANAEVSPVMLNVAAGSTDLTLYLKVTGGVQAALPAIQAEDIKDLITAFLGTTEANLCNMQGFDDRIYCMFTLPPNTLGTLQDLMFFTPDCEDPVYLLQVSIPEPKSGDAPDDPGLTCTADLVTPDCEAAGGHMSPGTTTAPKCVCP